MEAWRAVQFAAEAESRSAEAAALATAYEELAEQQANLARELSKPPPGSFVRSIFKNIASFFHPITSVIVSVWTTVTSWLLGVWTYFSSGTCWRQFCSLCSRSVEFAKSVVVTAFTAVKNAALYIFGKVSGFCCYVRNGIKAGFDCCLRFIRVVWSRIVHPKGSIGGDATA